MATKRSSSPQDAESTLYLGTCIDDLRRHYELTGLLVRAVHRLSASREMELALINLRKVEGKPIEQKSIDRRLRQVSLAETERSEGFPTIIGHAIISLHATLEQTIRGFVARRIAERHTALEIDLLQKIKIRVSDFFELSPLEHAYAILDAFETEKSSRKLPGAERFNLLMGLLGIKPSLSKEVEEALAELSSVRHLLAHGQKHADARFCLRCPWLRASVGDTLKLNRTAFRRYAGAVLDYLTSILHALTAQIEASKPPAS